MIHRIVTATAATALLLLSPPAHADGGVTVRIEVALEHNEGKVRCALHKKGTWMKTPIKGDVVAPKNKKARCTFTNVQPGTWAIALHHDEDGDGEMDTNFIGIPSEGVGTSRDAEPNMGPPAFEDATFTVADKDLSLTATMQY